MNTKELSDGLYYKIYQNENRLTESELEIILDAAMKLKALSEILPLLSQMAVSTLELVNLFDSTSDDVKPSVNLVVT